ncbi:hypothetical protein K443DRAFT_685206 [Laccaria amethystina LaAM-08-1]|uniref:Uncharacterized protein n=1 Tax=Laccaria amethystina LaAM-08-1 TaxID=1095629 RepID=A0A0C9X4I3_9AGAR|nr:hypothetical protein K443DRAFT_685206 [Laccaria amethystina LaAM-08-1]
MRLFRNYSPNFCLSFLGIGESRFQAAVTTRVVGCQLGEREGFLYEGCVSLFEPEKGVGQLYDYRFGTSQCFLILPCNTILIPALPCNRALFFHKEPEPARRQYR